MREIARIWLPNAKKTLSSGCSLARSISTIPLTILLDGELGAGKTTFLQGFAKGLGVKENLTSPTYALEQRYTIRNHKSPFGLELMAERHTTNTKQKKLPATSYSSSPSLAIRPRAHGREGAEGKLPVRELLHLDLYRLFKEEAGELVRSTDDFQGIRCIEWAERFPKGAIQEPYIRITLQEGKGNKGNKTITSMPSAPLLPLLPSGRLLTISFHDLPLPSRKEILLWRKQVRLPIHIQKHCDAVGKFAKKLALKLLERGIICRPLALQRAGEVHDLFRFIDFRPGGWEREDSKENKRHWKNWKEKFSGLRHEAACAKFLEEHGYGALASIVAVHGLTLPPPLRVTIEQKLLFYADKRVRIDEVVSLDERFNDFRRRYGSGKASEEHKIWYREAKRVEKELFPKVSWKL